MNINTNSISANDVTTQNLRVTTSVAPLPGSVLVASNNAGLTKWSAGGALPVNGTFNPNTILTFITPDIEVILGQTPIGHYTVIGNRISVSIGMTVEALSGTATAFKFTLEDIPGFPRVPAIAPQTPAIGIISVSSFAPVVSLYGSGIVLDNTDPGVLKIEGRFRTNVAIDSGPANQANMTIIYEYTIQ